MNKLRLLITLVFFSGQLYAEPEPAIEETYEHYLSPSDISAKPSLIREAGGAVMGRVFGVQGTGADIQYHVVELSGRKPGNSAVRSAFVPGWGQFFNGEKVKASILFVATIGAAVGAYS